MPISGVSRKCLTSIPADVRRRLGIEEGDMLAWEVDEGGRYAIIRVIKNPLRVLRGKYSRRDLTYDEVEGVTDNLTEGG